MPQVTVYIRKSDIEAWAQVERKSEFIHNALVGETQAKPSPQATVVPQTVLDPLVCNYKGCGKRMVDMRAMANHRRNTGHGDVV